MASPVDDRSGTVRRADDGRIAVKREFATRSSYMWIVIHGRDRENPGSTAMWDHEVAEWPVIGAVPGTPAADA